MLKKYLIQLINEKLKKFLGEWDMEKNIRINSIKTPNVTFTNVPLPSKLLDLIQLPLVLEYSNISSVSCQCSWSTLLGNGSNNFFKVVAEDVEIRLRFLYPSEWSSSACLNLFFSKKKKKLEQLKQMSSVFSNRYGSTASSQSFESRILKVLKLVAKNIHIRIFEDHFSSIPFALDIYIADVIMSYPSLTDKRISENEIEGLKNGSLQALWIQFIGLHIIYKEFDTYRYLDRKRAWIYENFRKDFKYHIWNKRRSTVRLSQRNSPHNNASMKYISSFYSSKKKLEKKYSIRPITLTTQAFIESARGKKHLPVNHKLNCYHLKKTMKKNLNCFKHTAGNNKSMFWKRSNSYRNVRRRQVLLLFLRFRRNYVDYKKNNDYFLQAAKFYAESRRKRSGKLGKHYRMKDCELRATSFFSIKEGNHLTHADVQRKRMLKKQYSLSLSLENSDDNVYGERSRDESLDSVQTYSQKYHERSSRHRRKTKNPIFSDGDEIVSVSDPPLSTLNLNDISRRSWRGNRKTNDQVFNAKLNGNQRKQTTKSKVTIHEDQVFNLNRYETPFSTPDNIITSREASWKIKCSRKGKCGVNDENKYGFRITPYQGIEMHVLLKIWNVSNMQRQSLTDTILRTISIYFIAHKPENFQCTQETSMSDTPTKNLRKETVWPDAEYLNLPLVITFTEAALEAFLNSLKFIQLWQQFMKGVIFRYEKVPTESICKRYIELWYKFINDEEFDASTKKQLDMIEKELPLYCISALREQAETFKYRASPLSQLNIRLKKNLHNFLDNLFSNRRKDKIEVKEFESNNSKYVCNTKKSASGQMSSLNNDSECSKHFKADDEYTTAKSVSEEYKIFKENDFHWFHYEGVIEILIPHLCLEIIPGVRPGSHTQTSLLSILPKSSKIPIFKTREYSVKVPPTGSIARMGRSNSFVISCSFRFVNKKVNPHCKEMHIFLDNARIVKRPVELFLVRSTAQLYRKYQHNSLIQVPLPHHLIISQPVTEQEPELVFCCMVDYENVVAQIKKNSNEFLKSNKTEKNFYLNGSATSQRNKNKMQRNCTISKSNMDKNQMSYGTSQNMESEVNLTKRFSIIIRENRVEDFKKTLLVLPHCIVNVIPFLHFFQHFPPKSNVNRDLFESIDAPISQNVIDAQNVATFSALNTRLMEINISYVYVLLSVQNDLGTEFKAKNAQHENIDKKKNLFEVNSRGERRRCKTMNKDKLVARKFVAVIKNFNLVHTQRRPISVKLESVHVYAASCLMKIPDAKETQSCFTFDMSTKLELFPECTTTSKKIYDEKQKIIIFQTHSLRFPFFEDGDLLLCLRRFHLVKTSSSQNQTSHCNVQLATTLKPDVWNSTKEASPQSSGLVNDYSSTMDIGVDYVLLSCCDTLLLAICYIEALHLQDIPLKNILLRFKTLTNLRYLDPKTHAIPYVPKYEWKSKIEQGKLKLLNPVVVDFNKSNSHSSESLSVPYSREGNSIDSLFRLKERRNTFKKFPEKQYEKCTSYSQVLTTSKTEFLIGKVDMLFFFKKKTKLRTELHLLGGSAEKVLKDQYIVKKIFEVEVQEIYADHLFPTTNVKCFSSVFISANTAHVFGEKNMSLDCKKNSNSKKNLLPYYYLKNHETFCITCGKANCLDSLHNRNTIFVPDTTHRCSFVLRKRNYCMEKRKCFCKNAISQTNCYAYIQNRRSFSNENHSDANTCLQENNSLSRIERCISNLPNESLNNGVSMDEGSRFIPPLSSMLLYVKPVSDSTTRILYKSVLNKIFTCPVSNIFKMRKFSRTKPQVLARFTWEKASREIIFNMHSLHMFLNPSVVECIRKMFQGYNNNIRLIRNNLIFSYKQVRTRKEKIPKMITLSLKKLDRRNSVNPNGSRFVLHAVDYDGTHTSTISKINYEEKRSNSSNLTRQLSGNVESLPICKPNVKEDKDKYSDLSSTWRKLTVCVLLENILICPCYTKEPSKHMQKVTVMDRTPEENEGLTDKYDFAEGKRGQLNEEKLVSDSMSRTGDKNVINLLKSQRKIRSLRVEGWPAVRNLRQLFSSTNGLRQSEDGRCACLDFDSIACRVTGCLKISLSYMKELDDSKNAIYGRDKWIRNTIKYIRTSDCTNGGQADKNCTWPLMSLILRFITAKVVFSPYELQENKPQKDQLRENNNNGFEAERPHSKWETERKTRENPIVLTPNNDKTNFEEVETKKKSNLLKKLGYINVCALRIDDITLWSNSFWKKSNNLKRKLNVQKEFKIVLDESDTIKSFECDVPLSYSLIHGTSPFNPLSDNDHRLHSLHQQKELHKNILLETVDRADGDDVKTKLLLNSRDFGQKRLRSPTYFCRTQKLSLLPSIPPYPFHKYHSCLLPVFYFNSMEKEMNGFENTSQFRIHYSRERQTSDCFVSLKLPPSIFVIEPYTMRTYTNIISYFKSWVQLLNASSSQRTVFIKPNHYPSKTEKSISINTSNIRITGVRNKKTNARSQSTNLSKSSIPSKIENLLSQISQLSLNLYVDVEIHKFVIRMAETDKVIASLKIPARLINVVPDTHTVNESVCYVPDILIPHNYYRIIQLDADSVPSITFSTCFLMQCTSRDLNNLFTVRHKIPDIVAYQKYSEKYRRRRGELYKNAIPALDSLVAISMENETLKNSFSSKKVSIGITVNTPVFYVNFSLGRRIRNSKKSKPCFDVHNNIDDQPQKEKKNILPMYGGSYENAEDDERNVEGLELTILRVDTEISFLQSLEHYYASVCIREILLHDTKKKIVYSTNKLYHYMSQLTLRKLLNQHNICHKRRSLGKSNAGATEENQIVLLLSCNKFKRMAKAQMHSTRIEIHLKTLDVLHNAILSISRILRDYQILFIVFPDILMQGSHIATTTQNLRGLSGFCFGCVRKKIKGEKNITIFFPSRLPLQLQANTPTCMSIKGLYNEDFSDVLPPYPNISLISTEEILCDNGRPIEHLRLTNLRNRKTSMTENVMPSNRESLSSFYLTKRNNNYHSVSPFWLHSSRTNNGNNVNDKSKCSITLKKSCSTSIMNNKGVKLVEGINEDESTKQLVNLIGNSASLVKPNNGRNHMKATKKNFLSLYPFSRTKINTSESRFDEKSHFIKPIWFKNKKRQLLKLTKQFDKNETKKDSVKLVQTFQNRLSALWPLKSLDIKKSKKRHSYVSSEGSPYSLNSSFQYTPDRVNRDMTKKNDLIFEKWVAQMAIFCLEIWLCPHESYCGLKRKKNSQFTYKNSKIISSGSIFSSTQHGVDVSNTYKDKYSERTINFTNIPPNNSPAVLYSSVIPANFLQFQDLASVQNNLTNTHWRCKENIKISHRKCHYFTGCLVSFYSEIKYKGKYFSGYFKMNELDVILGFPRHPFNHTLWKSTLFNLDNQPKEKEPNMKFSCSQSTRRICYKYSSDSCNNLKDAGQSFSHYQNYLQEKGENSKFVHSSRKTTFKSPTMRSSILFRGIPIKKEDATRFPSVLMDVSGEMLIPGLDNKEKRDCLCDAKYFMFTFEKQDKENMEENCFVTIVLKHLTVNLSMERLLHLQEVCKTFTFMRHNYFENWDKKILFSSDFFSNLLVNQFVAVKVESLLQKDTLDMREKIPLSNGVMGTRSTNTKKNYICSLKHYQETGFLNDNKSSHFFTPTSPYIENGKRICDIRSNGCNEISFPVRNFNRRVTEKATLPHNVDLFEKKLVPDEKEIINLFSPIKKGKPCQPFETKKFNKDMESIDRRIIRFFFWLCNPRDSGLVTHFRGCMKNVTLNFRASYVKIIKLTIEESNVEATVPLVKSSFIMFQILFKLAAYNPIAIYHEPHHEPLCISLRINRTEPYLNLSKPLPWLDVSLQINPFGFSITSESLQLCRYIYDLVENSNENDVKCRGSRKMIIHNATHTPIILFQQMNKGGFTLHPRIKRNYDFHHIVLREFEKGTASSEFPLWFGLKLPNFVKTKHLSEHFQTDNSIDIKIEDTSISSESTKSKKLGIKKQFKNQTTLNLNTNEEIRDFVLQILNLGEENLHSQFLRKYYKQLLLSNTENVKNILKFIIDNISSPVKEYRKNYFFFTIANVIQIFRHKKNWMFLGNLLADYQTARAYSTSNGVYDVVVEPVSTSPSAAMRILCVGTAIQIANLSGFSMKIFKSYRTGNVMRFTERLQKDVVEILSGQSSAHRYATKDAVLILEPQSNIFVPLSWFTKNTIPFIVPYLSDARISALASDCWLNDYENLCPPFKFHPTNNVHETSSSYGSDSYHFSNEYQRSDHFETSVSSQQKNNTIDEILTPQFFSLLQNILEYVSTPKYTQKKKLFKQRTTLNFRKNIAWEVILETTEIPTNTSDQVACRYQIKILPYTTIQNTLPFPITVNLYPFHSKKKKNDNHSTICFKSPLKNSSETDFYNLLHSRPLTAYILPHHSWLIPLEKRCILLKVAVHGSPIETFEQRFSASELLKNYSYSHSGELAKKSRVIEKNDLSYQMSAQNRKPTSMPTYTSTVLALFLPYSDSSTSCIHLQCGNKSVLDRNKILNEYLTLYTKLNESKTSFPVTSTYSNFSITADVSRQRINFQLPFLIENTCQDLVVILNSKIIPPGCRLYVSEDEAKLCRVNVVRKKPKYQDPNGEFYDVSSMSHRIDLLGPTTTTRPPILLRFDKGKRRYLRIRKRIQQSSLTTRKNLKDSENLPSFLSKEIQQHSTENKNYRFKASLKKNFLCSNEKKNNECTQNSQSPSFSVPKILSRIPQLFKKNQEMCNDNANRLTHGHENGFASSNDFVISSVLPIGGLDCTASPPPNAYTLCQIKSQNSITSGTEYPFKKNVVWSWSTFKETLHEKLQKPVCFVERIFQFYATTVLKFFTSLGSDPRKETNLRCARHTSNTSWKSLDSDCSLCRHSKYINGIHTVTDINSLKPLFNQSLNSMQKLSSCSSDLSGQHFDHDSHSMDCDPVVAKQNTLSFKSSLEKPEIKCIRSNLKTFLKRKRKKSHSIDDFVKEVPSYVRSRKHIFLENIKTKKKRKSVYVQRTSSFRQKCTKTYSKCSEYRNFSQQKKKGLRKSRHKFTKRIKKHLQKPFPESHIDIEASIVSLGISVRYASVPYENSKIITISPRYIFYSQLPYSVVIRNTKLKYLFQINGGSSYFTPEAMSLNLHPYQCAPFHTKEYHCYIEMMKDDVVYKSSDFTLSPPRIPFLYQVQLTCPSKKPATSTYTVQINVVSGMFPSFSRSPPSPYSSNVTFFILSIPDYFEFEIHNCSSYDIQVKSSNLMNVYPVAPENSLGRKSRFSSSLNHVFRDSVTSMNNGRENDEKKSNNVRKTHLHNKNKVISSIQTRYLVIESLKSIPYFPLIRDDEVKLELSVVGCEKPIWVPFSLSRVTDEPIVIPFDSFKQRDASPNNCEEPQMKEEHLKLLLKEQHERHTLLCHKTSKKKKNQLYGIVTIAKSGCRMLTVYNSHSSSIKKRARTPFQNSEGRDALNSNLISGVNSSTKSMSSESSNCDDGEKFRQLPFLMLNFEIDFPKLTVTWKNQSEVILALHLTSMNLKSFILTERYAKCFGDIHHLRDLLKEASSYPVKHEKEYVSLQVTEKPTVLCNKTLHNFYDQGQTTKQPFQMKGVPSCQNTLDPFHMYKNLKAFMDDMLSKSQASVDFTMEGIHLDHYLKGDVPVILQSVSNEKSGSQHVYTPFTQISLLKRIRDPVFAPSFDAITIKLSPLVVNLDFAVVEELWTLAEKTTNEMFVDKRFSVDNPSTRKNDLELFKEAMDTRKSSFETSIYSRNPYRKYYLVCIPRYSMKQEYHPLSDTSLGLHSYHEFSDNSLKSTNSFHNSFQTEIYSHSDGIDRTASMASCRNKLQNEIFDNAHIYVLHQENLHQVHNKDFKKFWFFLVSYEHILDILNQIYNKCHYTMQGMNSFLNSDCSWTLLENNPLHNFDQNDIINGVHFLSQFNHADIQPIHRSILRSINKSTSEMSKYTIQHVKKVFEKRVIATYSSSRISHYFLFPCPEWRELKQARHFYIHSLKIHSCSMTISIRTSDKRINRHVLNIMDALPLDTPYTRVEIGGVTRMCKVSTCRELLSSLHDSYVKQLIRQTLPYAWLFNPLAFALGLFRGTKALILTVSRESKRKRPNRNFSIEGAILGFRLGFVILTLYTAGGFFQTISHFANILHKLLGGSRSKPHGLVDAFWKGTCGLFEDMLITPWVLLFRSPLTAFARDDSIFKVVLIWVACLFRCFVSPLFGLLNLITTITEGLANVLIGDFEQYTRIHEQYEFQQQYFSKETGKKRLKK